MPSPALPASAKTSARPRHRAWTQRLVWAIACALASTAVLASIPVLFGSPQPIVFIQWGAVSASERLSLERTFGLTEATPRGEDTWGYVPTRTAPDELRAIVTHPSVLDADGIDQRALVIADPPSLTPRRGGLLEAPAMARAARLLAYLLALLAGILLLRSALVSPPLQPDSAVRRAVRALVMSARVVGRACTARLARRKAAPYVSDGSAPTAAVAATAVLLFAATLAWRFLAFTGFTNDHYVHVALAQQVLLGDRPIRDFIDSGWPLVYLLSAGAWRLAGDALATEWAIAAAGFALGAACTVAAARRFSGSLLIAVLVTVVEILISPRTYSYPKVLAYAAAACAIVALAARPSRRRIVLMAAIVAVAFLLRHDHGLFIGMASAVCLVVASRTEGWRVAAGRVAVLTAATMVLLLPWILFVALNGGLIAYFQGGIEYARAEADATALTSWPTLHLTSPLDNMANAEAWLFWLFWSLPVVCAAIVSVRVRRGRERWTGELAAVAALIVLAALVDASFLRQALQVRLPDAIVPAAVLGAWALGACWVGRWRRRARQRAVQFATLTVLTISVAAISRVADLPGQYDNTDIGRGLSGVSARAVEVSHLIGRPHRQDVSPPSRFAAALMPFFAYVDRCSSPSDRLMVTGEFPEVLVMAGRGFAGDSVVFGSWYAPATHQERTLERLRVRPALFVLHIGDYTEFHRRFGLVDAYVEAEYEPMAEIPVEGADSIRILAQRSRTPTRTDSQSGWPCYR